MKLVPVYVELENNSTNEKMMMTVEYEIVFDSYKSGSCHPFALDGKICELPEVPLVPVLEGVER